MEQHQDQLIIQMKDDSLNQSFNEFISESNRIDGCLSTSEREESGEDDQMYLERTNHSISSLDRGSHK